MILHDEQKTIRSYAESEVYEARIEARCGEKIETAKRLLRMKKLAGLELI